jgi:hypothetical protein
VRTRRRYWFPIRLTEGRERDVVVGDVMSQLEQVAVVLANPLLRPGFSIEGHRALDDVRDASSFSHRSKAQRTDEQRADHGAADSGQTSRASQHERELREHSTQRPRTPRRYEPDRYRSHSGLTGAPCSTCKPYSPTIRVGQKLWQWEFDTHLTLSALDAWRKRWTRVDGFPSKSVQSHPPRSTDFRLPTVRNQQVIGSNPRAGSNQINNLARDARRWQRRGPVMVPRGLLVPRLRRHTYRGESPYHRNVHQMV